MDFARPRSVATVIHNSHRGAVPESKPLFCSRSGLVQERAILRWMCARIGAQTKLMNYRKYCDKKEFIMRFSGSNWRRILRKKFSRLPNTSAG